MCVFGALSHVDQRAAERDRKLSQSQRISIRFGCNGLESAPHLFLLALFENIPAYKFGFGVTKLGRRDHLYRRAPSVGSNPDRPTSDWIREGFGLFKFDGIGGGLAQSGGDEFLGDFEAVLQLVRAMKPLEFGLPVEETEGRL